MVARGLVVGKQVQTMVHLLAQQTAVQHCHHGTAAVVTSQKRIMYL